MNATRPSGMHRVFSDLVDLALLQLQLFAVDGREAGRRGVGAVFYLGLAGAILISTATVGLFGCAWVLHDLAEWPLGWCLLAASGLALLVVLAILGLAYLSLKKAAAAMHEVGAEFADNVEWLRAVVAAPSAQHPAEASGGPSRSGSPGTPPYPAADDPAAYVRTRAENDLRGAGPSGGNREAAHSRY